MKLKDKIIFCFALLAVFVWFLYLINSVLAPFICAIIIAYFFNPLANKLQKYQLSRTFAALIILGVFLLAITLIMVFLAPILYDQFSSLINAIPKYYDIFITKTYPKIVTMAAHFGLNLNNDITSYFDNKNLTKLLSFSNDILGNIMKSGVTIVNVISLIFVTPILIFYLLKDWNILVNQIDKYLPKRYASSIRKVFREIDYSLSGYVKGQFNVCLILGILYGTGLSFSDLNFGFLIGFLTGIMSFIPYIGMLIGATITVIIGLFQWGFDLAQFGIIATVFLVGQIIESNFLTPKLIGEKIGLHPAWIIFGLFVFATLFGFTGVILAVPMCAIVGVVIKFIASEYLKRNN